MYTKSQLEYIKAITPIHAGTGQDLGIADMPIQREKHSNIPKIEASSLKGSIKSILYYKIKNGNCNSENNGEDDLKKMYKYFGPENGDEASSLIAFTDAKLLLFPIKSAADIFKLVTCPYILKRWVEDLKLSKINQGGQVDKNENENKNNYNRIDDLDVKDGQAIDLGEGKDNIILEDYVFKKSETQCKEVLKEIFKKEDVDVKKIIILSDSDFVELVTLYTEIITRNKIDTDTGVAKDGGLFTEEYLPAESILYFIVLEAPNFNGDEENNAIKYYTKHIGDVFQVGGDFTIGKGFVKRLSKERGRDVNQES
mgnify:FL=1